MTKDCANSIESLCLPNFSPPREQPLSPFRQFSPPLPSKNPDTMIGLFSFRQGKCQSKEVPEEPVTIAMYLFIF